MNTAMEYRSQAEQDRQECRKSASCGPHHRPTTRPFSCEDEIQWAIWDCGMRVDVSATEGGYMLIGPSRDSALSCSIARDYMDRHEMTGSVIYKPVEGDK
jgi:hypothetical protein